MKTTTGFIFFLLLLPSCFALDLDIDVVGLFKNKAMLNISGKNILLKVGERSPEGVLLVSADSHMASIEYTGRTFSLGLSSRISTDFQKPESVSVSILLSNAGQYRTSGNINGRPVSFLVDTGATIIALNTPTAKALGLDLSTARPLRATTAGGVVESREVNLASVEVGGIRINNVKAAVLEGDYPEEILLGMSFLSKVDLTESAGIMQLTVKY